MRIVGGHFRGKRLIAPTNNNIRPTSDRVREALFNILIHGNFLENLGFSLEESRVLDLFAGTGALGLEALSRGASFCLFVEDDAKARSLIRSNIEALNLTGVTKVFRRDATILGEAGRFGKFDLLFADPPYGLGLGERALMAAHEGGWFNDNALCILEEHANVEISLPDGFQLLDQREYGESQILILNRR